MWRIWNNTKFLQLISHIKLKRWSINDLCNHKTEGSMQYTLEVVSMHQGKCESRWTHCFESSAIHYSSVVRNYQNKLIFNYFDFVSSIHAWFQRSCCMGLSECVEILNCGIPKIVSVPWLLNTLICMVYFDTYYNN